MLCRRGANPPHTHTPWHPHGSLRFVIIVIIIVNTSYDNDNDDNTFLPKLCPYRTSAAAKFPGAAPAAGLRGPRPALAPADAVAAAGFCAAVATPPRSV